MKTKAVLVVVAVAVLLGVLALPGTAQVPGGEGASWQPAPGLSAPGSVPGLVPGGFHLDDGDCESGGNCNT